jgi:hypothetical protein
MTERRERGWLPEGGNPPRRGVLEDTLFRRLEEMRKKPPGELFELLERTLEVLRATKEALLEQRREIRSLATAVDTLRSRVDQLVHQPHPEPVRAPEPEPVPEPEPALEHEPEPEPDEEPELEPEPEPDLLPAATHPNNHALPLETAVPAETAEPVQHREDFAEPAPELVPERPPEHVLMLSTTAGYRILIGAGAEPASSVDVDGVVFQVAGRMSSPFPGDSRTAYFATAASAALS